ncbi:MAG TPA: hypothetical protein VGP17_03915 [Solirubrobacteraceae bacterium]|jgi:hypothetical protein|nr:hypothetical protein [Solirubrobacteraceae bacterium]
MSISIALEHRFAQWCGTLIQHGYTLKDSYVNVSGGSLWICAVRPVLHGGPPTTIYVWEVWLVGIDPDGLMPALDGCHLHHCSWHAQIGGSGAIDAERLDVDRSKPAGLRRHRHPHGQPNAKRERTTISTPGAWLVHVETIVSTLYSPSDETGRI